jgi:hypothetical protein
MYFKDFPKFLYDFNYGDGKTKTTIVSDITRNVRLRKEILRNVTIFDEYDIQDGETPEIIAEKFYGTPEYHWIVMLTNDKYDWITDFPLTETQLVKHTQDVYNPQLSSNDWYWDVHEDGITYIHIKITSTDVPFELAYLTAPVKITLSDATKQFVKVINFPTDPIGLEETTQYFYFPYIEPWDITQFGKPGATATSGVGAITIYVDTEGRENNPVMYVNQQGYVVNADPTNTNLIPLSGEEVVRIENDLKRRIRLISPELIEVVIRNYEELL